MTWPWATRELLSASTFEDKEEERARDEEGQGDVAGPGGLPLLSLQAPGGGVGEPSRKGAYSVAADLVVEGEFLAKAISRIEWLTISFRESPTSKKFPPFPGWVLKLVNLKGLNLLSYPHKCLPEEISNLKNLERFHAYRSNLTRLPRSIGCLSNLIELDCYTSYGLHYLPYEITRCPKLRSSRFSTRALYNNYKNRMAVPPLQPWWQGDATVAVTPSRICQALAHKFSPEFTAQKILPYLAWETCSVCGQAYRLGQGYHTWSHRVIATDRQSLLSFCCSKSCAAKVSNQIYYDPTSRSNKAVDPERVYDPEFDLDLDKAARVWYNHAARGSDLTSCRRRGGRNVDTYQLWMRDHLGVEWEKGPVMDRLTWTKTDYNLPGSCNRCFMVVVAGGDIRMEPNSTSPAVDRLEVGRIVLASRTKSKNSKDRREWVQLWINPGSTGENYWTAKTKKDGTLKLKELKPNDPGSTTWYNHLFSLVHS